MGETISMGEALVWIVCFILWMHQTERLVKQIRNRRKKPMVEWNITIVEGTQPIYNHIKELPENVRPPKYINSINNKNFVPIAGEFELVRVDEDGNFAIYEKINSFFGGK